MAAHSLFTKEIGDAICSELACGKSLLSICEAMGLKYSTVRGWEKDHADYAADSARAREHGCDYLAEDALRIADTPQIGEETTTKADGGVEVRSGDMLAHRKLQIDTRIRLIGKWSKRYGEKQQVEHSGEMTINGLAGRMRAKRADADQ